MKRCPQCNNLYEDSTVFCHHDGRPLVPENLSLPSDADLGEEPTIIRQEPIFVDLNFSNAPTEQFPYEVSPTQSAAPTIVEKTQNSSKSLMYLFVGLILGGSLVLTGFSLAGKVFQSNQTVENNEPISDNSVTPIQGKKSSDLNKSKASEEHGKRTATADKEFNGRVIIENASLRDAPNRTSKQTDILPVADRITIMNRENAKSPWFFVVCEHGSSGWIHGNMIKYTNK